MEVCTVGGFDEVGRNMTAVKIEEDVIILDAGFHLPAIIEMQENEVGYKRPDEKSLRQAGAIPDDLVLDKLGWTDKVRAIVIGHAHLDHIGALPYIVHRYPKAPVLASPFTMAFLEETLNDDRMTIPNKKITVKPNSSYTIKGKSGNIVVEFINMTHSTPHTCFVALHTKEGILVYTLDFKLDNYPTLSKAPNYKRLSELRRKGVNVLVVDSLYSDTEGKTPSERIARHLVEEAISKVKRDRRSAIFIATFSSHIERIHSIVEFAKGVGREIVVLGRSMNKYIACAVKTNLFPLKNSVRIFKYRKQVDSMFKKIEKDRNRYFVICTGHQGEPGSILDRVVKGEANFKFREGDNVIVSSSVIPVPINIAARDKMDKKLRRMGVKIQTDVHVSGHPSRDDLREVLRLIKPKHVIPAHGSLDKTSPMIDVAREFGYKFGETSHLSSNGKVLKF